jgi:hypothetical protein
LINDLVLLLLYNIEMTSMKKFKLILALLAFCNFSFSQTGNVTIKKDQRIDALVQKQSAVIPPAVKTEIDGYRIQLVFDGNKDVVNNARSKFISKYPKVDTYIEFNAPNFILKAGDFRTKLEAEKIKAGIELDFPTSFIIKERVNIPRLEKE